MKKIIVLFLFIFFITGCGKYGEKDVIKDLENKIEKGDSYKLSGNLEISNNDDVYNYVVNVSYKKDDYYKVVMRNEVNNYTQIILKNDDAVYIVTPSLNKSFKFQSEWPYDNSQIYLLDSLLKDIKNDKDRKFKISDDGYLFVTKVKYPNNSKLIKQKIRLDKKLKVKEVSVYDENNVVRMKMKFNSIKYAVNFDEKYFKLKSVSDNIDVMKEDDEQFTDVIYPLFLPNGTKLVDEEKIVKDNGQRVIMTFDGEKPFLLVEESINVEDEFTVVPTYGEPYRLMDSLGVMTDNSLSWVSNGIEYYIVSDVLSQDEMIEIAQSIYSLPTMK